MARCEKIESVWEEVLPTVGEMWTDDEWESLLRELEVRYPIDGYKLGEIKLLYGGWAFGQAMIKRKTIVLPKRWLKFPAAMQFAVIHEYAHLYREKMGAKRFRLGFHDKEMKRIETQFLNENGIQFKRWVRYPRMIVSEKYGTFDPSNTLTVHDCVMGAFSWNAWGLLIAVICLDVMNLFEASLDSHPWLWLFVGLFLSEQIYNHGTNIAQNIVWLKHRRMERRAKAVSVDG